MIILFLFGPKLSSHWYPKWKVIVIFYCFVLGCICTGFSIVLIVQKVCRICEPLKTNILKKRLGIYRSHSPNPCVIFYFVSVGKNECLWHSVKTPNRDMDNKCVAEKSFYIFFFQTFPWSWCFNFVKLELLSTKLLSIKLIYFTQKIFVL